MLVILMALLLFNSIFCNIISIIKYVCHHWIITAIISVEIDWLENLSVLISQIDVLKEKDDFLSLQNKLEAFIVNHSRYILTIRICSPNINVFKVPLPYGGATETA